MILSLLLQIAFARPVPFDVSTLPSPRPSGQWSVDRANLLSASDRARVEAILAGVNQRANSEIALVVLPSVGDQVPKNVAVQLFKQWGIGHRYVDDGLLILLVVDQRRLEIETGYGLEGVLPDVTLSRIEREHMTPAFRRGDFAGGLIAGLMEIDRVLARGDRGLVGHLVEPASWTLEEICFGLAGLLVLIALLLSIWAHGTADPYLAYRRVGQNFGGLFFWQIAILPWFGGWLVRAHDLEPRVFYAGAFGAFWSLLGRQLRAWWQSRLRATTRRCAECGHHMTKQSDRAEQAFETPMQRLEEKIGAVDYDVWVCAKRHVRLDAYRGAKAGDFTKCTKCGGMTRRMLSDVIVSATTNHHYPRGHRTYACLSCGHQSHEYYELPTSSDGSGSSGGFGSSGGGGGGGGSFGGGSSGGGGAGSDW